MKNTERRMTPRMELGRRGEDVACEFLTGKGHTIVQRNFRVIWRSTSSALTGMVCILWKSRKPVAPVAVSPEENVTVSKQRKVADAALRYLNMAKDKRIPPDAEVNFDIVAVTFGGGKEIVEWFPSAFYPMYL